jgi:hypothetical protein
MKWARDLAGEAAGFGAADFLHVVSTFKKFYD